jgi:peptidoglycan/LPS O-acetylase OafA/YrhL
MISGETWRLGHRPALDGLRGVAIVLVLCAHFDNPVTNPISGVGVTGVTVFFTLSGFLITALLLEEHARTGRIRLAAFYRRRVFRLMPALLAVVVFVLAVQATGTSLGVSKGMVTAVLFYASNWWQLAHVSGLNGLSNTWSLSIEEQFYLVWPAALLFGARWGRRGVTRVALAGMAVSVVALIMPGGSLTWGSLERASNLLAGCLLAVWLSGRREGRSRPWVAALALCTLAPQAMLKAALPDPLWALMVPASTVVVLWAVAQGDGVRWLSGPVLRWFGRRSYGIYLWHYPMLYAIPMWPGVPWYVRSGCVLTISLLTAEVSWRCIERPMARLGRRQDKGWIAVPSHQPVAVSSIG